MTMKRIVAWIMILCFLTGMLIGCKSDDAPDESVPDVGVDDVPGVSDDTPEPPDETTQIEDEKRPETEQEKPVYLPDINAFSYAEMSVDFDDYFWWHFSPEKILGNPDVLLGDMSNPAVFIEKIEEIWVSIYGERIRKENRPYRLYYDNEAEIWYVRGTLEQPTDGGHIMGGVPEILVQKKDGRVIAVWHSA